MQASGNNMTASDEAGAPALRVTSVSHAFGDRAALQDVSLTVPRGGFVALLGVNGAGKTTLFNLITRLYDAGSGKIDVCGHDLRSDTFAALSALGIVFQSRALDANLTVAQNLRYAAALHGLGAGEARRRVRDLLTRFEAAELANRIVRTLSGGQAQRIEIARALIHRPGLLLCDEATAGLDLRARRSLTAEAHRLAAEEHVGVLWATHIIDEIAPSDMVVILHQGVVLATGRASDLAPEGELEAEFLRLTGVRA